MLSWQRGRKNRIFTKVVSLIMVQVFFLTSACYPTPSTRSLFKNKRPDYKAIQEQRQDVLRRKQDVFSGKKDSKRSSYIQDLTHRIKFPSLKDLSSIYIPAKLGKVVEVYQAPLDESRTMDSEQLLIVHIQDLHTNPEAQFNLASILELLIKDYNLDLVCSEGAEGEVDTSSVSSFPDYGVREKAARLFVESGELTGEEYLSITKYPDLPILGIEDKEIYFQNVVEFNKIMKFSQDAQVFIRQVKETLKKLKPKIYSKKLLEIDTKEAGYEEGKIETSEFLDYLIAKAGPRIFSRDAEKSRGQALTIDLGKFKNINLLQESLRYEKALDQEKIAQESQSLLTVLQAILRDKKNNSEMQSLLAKATLFNDQKVSPFSFYSYLDELARRHLKDELDRYPNLLDFVEYLEKVNSLDSVKLFDEIEALTYEVKDSLSTNENQKLLTKSLHRIKFLENFFNLEISNEELDYYLADREGFTVGWFKSAITDLTRSAGKVDSANFIDYNLDLIDKNLPELEYFYELAYERDRAMFNNTINEIKKRNVKVAALIAGGFHTRGITKLFKEKGYSYVVISPYSSTDIDEENYHFLLSGRRKPLSELIVKLNEKLRVILAFSHGRFKNYFNDLVDRGISEGWIKPGDIAPIDINKLPDEFMALETAMGLLVRMEQGYELVEQKINHMFVKRFREKIREGESIELRKIGEEEWSVRYGEVCLVVKNGRIEAVAEVPKAEVAFRITPWSTEKGEKEFLKDLTAWEEEVDLVLSLGVKPGDRAIEIGTTGIPTVGLLIAAQGGFWKGLDLHEEYDIRARRHINSQTKKYNLSQFGGRAEHGQANFLDYIKDKKIEDNSVRFVFGLTGVIGDPEPESDPYEVFSEMLRIVQNKGNIILGRGVGEEEKEEEVIEAVLASDRWKGKVEVIPIDTGMDRNRLIAYTVYQIIKKERLQIATDNSRSATQDDRGVKRVSRLTQAGKKQLASNQDVKPDKKPRYSPVREARLKEIEEIVPQLTKKLGRAPNVSEVALEMETLTGDTNKKKIATFHQWLKMNKINPIDYGMQRYARDTDEPIGRSFRFAGKRIYVPPELSGKINIKQTPDVRSNLRELVLQSIDEPDEQLVLTDSGNEINIAYKSADKGLVLERVVQKPKDKTTMDIATVSSFIAFSASILDIPFEYGVKRKAALMSWLEKEGIRFERAKTNRNISMGGDTFFLPSYYREHADRIITYKDAHRNIRFIALVDSENPENCFVLENRDGRVYSSESGEELIPSGRIHEKRRRRYRKDYDLSKSRDFRNFDEALDKTETEKAILRDFHNQLKIGLVQGNFVFWLRTRLRVISVKTKRAFKTREDREQYPLILERMDDGEQIIIRTHEGKDAEFTITGLEFKDNNPVILRGTYFNLSVILEMIRLGLFGDWVTADPLLYETFYYRKQKGINIGGTLKFNPIRTYRLDKEQGAIELGDLIDPRDLADTDINTGTVPSDRGLLASNQGITAEYTYAPETQIAMEKLQEKLKALNRKYGRWDERTAFDRMSKLQEEILEVFREINPNIRIKRGDILRLLAFNEHMKIFIEILDRLGNKEKEKITRRSLSLYWDPKKAVKLRHEDTRWQKRYEEMLKEETTLLDEIPKTNALHLLLYFSKWDESATGGLFVDLLKTVFEGNSSGNVMKISERLKFLEIQRLELVQWDLMNRFPEKEGFVLFHGAENEDEAEFFYDDSGYLIASTFFSDVPGYAEYFAYKEDGGAMIVTRVPFEKILYVAWLFTKEERGEPEISIMPGPLKEFGKIEIFYLDSEVDMGLYEKFKDRYISDRRSYYASTGIEDTHAELYDMLELVQGKSKDKLASNQEVTAQGINPAAKLFLINGQNINEPRWLKLQIVLRVLLSKDKAVTVADVRQEIHEKMKVHGAISKDDAITASDVKKYLEELASVGLIMQKKDRYEVDNERLAAIWADDLDYIKDEITTLIEKPLELKQALLEYEAASSMLWAGYPVEAFYPELRAVSMMDTRSQEILIKRIAGFEEDDPDAFYKHRIFDAIRLELLLSSDIHEDWLEHYAPNLVGRTIVIVASEISRMAGGLGRVINYHTIEKIRLVGKKAKLVWIEPYYKDFDETEDEWSTEKQLVAEFPVKLRDRVVRAQVYKRTKIIAIPNEKGEIENIEIENVLIRDAEKYYVGKIYKYGQEDSWASIDEFSEFFSKATLEFTKRVLEDRGLMQKVGWKRPILNIHDGQCLPIAFWKRLLYAKDDLMRTIPVVGVTHTYNNRLTMYFDSSKEARSFLSDTLGIPKEYHWYFLRPFYDKVVVDFTSSGIRTSHVPNGVSRMHAFELNPLDPQKRLVAITNGDIRALSAREFRRILRQKFGDIIDVEHPTADQIIEGKKEAVNQLQQMLQRKKEKDEEKGEYHVHGDIRLDPEKIIIEYAGRMVSEKFGIGADMPAWTTHNIKEMVKNGAQIVIFGNVQPYAESVELGRRLKHLAEEIAQDKQEKGNSSQYKGTFVFVDQFSPKEQIVLLAAASLQAQISRRHTGAAEYTESNATANGALHLGPPYIEGIIQLQGVILDRTRPGVGNTIVPYADTEEAYHEAFMWIIDCYNKRRRDYAEYQVTSVRLSRILEARNTAATYLKTWSDILGATDSFDTELESRNDAMTEAGLRLNGIHIERLSPGLMDPHEGDIAMEAVDESIEVEAVLLVAPGIELPQVVAHSNVASVTDVDVWQDYTLTLDKFDGRRATYKVKIPLHSTREDFRLTWKIDDIPLGNSTTDARIHVNRREGLASNMSLKPRIETAISTRRDSLSSGYFNKFLTKLFIVSMLLLLRPRFSNAQKAAFGSYEYILGEGSQMTQGQMLESSPSISTGTRFSLTAGQNLHEQAKDYYRKGDYNRAMEYIEAAIRLDPRNPYLYVTKVYICLARAQKSEGIKTFRTALSLAKERNLGPEFIRKLKNTLIHLRVYKLLDEEWDFINERWFKSWIGQQKEAESDLYIYLKKVTGDRDFRDIHIKELADLVKKDLSKPPRDIWEWHGKLREAMVAHWLFDLINSNVRYTTSHFRLSDLFEAEEGMRGRLCISASELFMSLGKEFGLDVGYIDVVLDQKGKPVGHVANYLKIRQPITGGLDIYIFDLSPGYNSGTIRHQKVRTRFKGSSRPVIVDYDKFEERAEDVIGLSANSMYADALVWQGWEYQEQAEQEVNERKKIRFYRRALHKYNQAAILDEGQYLAYLNTSNIYSILNKYDLAISYAEKATAANPYYPMSYIRLGWTYYNLKNYTEAIANFEKALNRKPSIEEQAVAYNGLGWTYHKLGKDAEAKTNFKKYYIYKGWSDFKQDNYDDAIKNFKQAIKLDPAYADAYLGLGWSHYKKGEYDKAIQNFERTLELDPDQAGARKGLDQTKSKLQGLQQGLKRKGTRGSNIRDSSVAGTGGVSVKEDGKLASNTGLDKDIIAGELEENLSRIEDFMEHVDRILEEQAGDSDIGVQDAMLLNYAIVATNNLSDFQGKGLLHDVLNSPGGEAIGPAWNSASKLLGHLTAISREAGTIERDSWKFIKEYFEAIKSGILEWLEANQTVLPIEVREISKSEFEEYEQKNKGKIVDVGLQNDYNFLDLSEEKVLRTMGAAHCIVPILVDRGAGVAALGHFTYTAGPSLESEESRNHEFYDFISEIRSDERLKRRRKTIYLFGGRKERRENKEALIAGIRRKMPDVEIVDLTSIDRILGKIMVGEEGIRYYYTSSKASLASNTQLPPRILSSISKKRWRFFDADVKWLTRVFIEVVYLFYKEKDDLTSSEFIIRLQGALKDPFDRDISWAIMRINILKENKINEIIEAIEEADLSNLDNSTKKLARALLAIKELKEHLIEISKEDLLWSKVFSKKINDALLPIYTDKLGSDKWRRILSKTGIYIPESKPVDSPSLASNSGLSKSLVNIALFNGKKTQPISIADGIDKIDIVFETKDRFARGRAIVLDPKKIKIEQVFIPEAVAYDFSEYSVASRDPKVVSGKRKFRKFPGKIFRQFLQEEDRDGNVLVASNSLQSNFWSRSDFLIINGELIAKPEGSCGLFEEEYTPLTGLFWVFSFDEGNLGVREVNLRDGKLDFAGQEIENGIASLPLILEGKDVSSLIERGKPALKGNQLPWDEPQNQKAAISALGKDKNGNIVLIHMAGDPNEREEITFSETAQILLNLGVVEAVALGTSADVNQYIKGDEQPYLEAKPRQGAMTAVDYPEGRPLASLLLVSSKSTTEKSSASTLSLINTALFDAEAVLTNPVGFKDQYVLLKEVDSNIVAVVIARPHIDKGGLEKVLKELGLNMGVEVHIVSLRGEALEQYNACLGIRDVFKVYGDFKVIMGHKIPKNMSTLRDTISGA